MQWTPFRSHSIWFICRNWPWWRPHHFWKLLFPSLIPLMSCSPAACTSDSSVLLFIKLPSFYFSKMIFSICLYLLETKLLNTNPSPTLSSWANEISSYVLNICIWKSHRCAHMNSFKVGFRFYPANLKCILQPVLWTQSCEPAEVFKPHSRNATPSYAFSVILTFCPVQRLADPSQWPLPYSRLRIISPLHCPTYSRPLPRLCPSHTFSNVLTGWPF